MAEKIESVETGLGNDLKDKTLQKVENIIEYYVLTNKLKDVVRSGWKYWNVKKERLESVAEHIYGTCMLAIAVWSESLPTVNLAEVLMTLAVHETEEIIIEEEIPMETVIKVNGMMCVHCKARVEKVCKAVPGTVDAVVDLQAKNVTVTGDADVAALKQAIVDAGYEVVE